MAKKRNQPGKTGGARPPESEPWFWMTRVMIGSLTYQALSINARRILDFLLYEHMSHGGQENGQLHAPYRQLERWGVTKSNISAGLEELIATGFVRKTVQGMRMEGGEGSRYALTWLPTLGYDPARRKTEHGAPPTHDWQKVISKLHAQRVGDVRDVRSWLKAETKDKRR